MLQKYAMRGNWRTDLLKLRYIAIFQGQGNSFASVVSQLPKGTTFISCHLIKRDKNWPPIRWVKVKHPSIIFELDEFWNRIS